MRPCIRLTRLWLATLLLLTGNAGLLAQDKHSNKDGAKEELTRLRGFWAVEGLEHYGNPVFFGIKLEGRGEVLIEGDQMSLGAFHRPPKDDWPSEPTYLPEFTVKLNTSASPKAIDLVARNGPPKGKTAPGIYQLDGDTLRLCLAMEGAERPAKFPARALEPRLEIVLPDWDVRDSVTSLAFSSDGKVLATGSERGETAIVWNVATGKKPHTISGGSVALSGDGKLLLTGTGDLAPILWDMATGKTLQTFRGHTHHFVPNVALSRDGKLVVTGCPFDQNAIVWEAATGQKLQTIKAPGGGIDSVTLSNDGKLLVTVSNEKTAILWETATGKNLRTFEKQSGGIRSIALSGDGKWLVTGSFFDETATVWDSATGKELQTLKGSTRGIDSLALSNDGKLVVTGSSNGTVIMWETATGKKLRTFQAPNSRVSAVALSPDGKHLWTGSSDGTTRLWRADSGKELCALLTLDRGNDWVVLTSDGLFDGSKGALKHVTYRTVGTRDLIDDDATRKKFHRPGLLAQLLKGEKPKPAAEFKSQKGQDLLVLTLKKDIHALEGASPRVYARIAFSPDGKILAFCEDRLRHNEGSIEKLGSDVKLWDVNRRKVIASLRQTGDVSCVAFSPDGKTLGTGTKGYDPDTQKGTGEVKLWDVATGKEKASLKGLYALAISPDFKTVAAVAKDRMVTLVELATGKEKVSLKAPAGTVLSVAFSPDGKFIAIGTGTSASNGQASGGAVKLWDVATGREKATLRATLKAKITAKSLTYLRQEGVPKDALKKLAGLNDKEFATEEEFETELPKFLDKIFDKKQRENYLDLVRLEIRPFFEGAMVWVWSLDFSPDSKSLACGDVFGNVLLWDVQSGKRLATLQAFNPQGKEDDINGAFSVAFSRGGKTLAAGTRRGIKFWDVKSGKTIEDPRGRSATVWSVAFSPDGRTVASAGKRRVIERFDRMEGDETLRLWELVLPKKADK
jgi:uncharacterized protein (TIGR03067 family)